MVFNQHDFTQAQADLGVASAAKFDEVTNAAKQFSTLSADQFKRLQASLQKPRWSACPVPVVFLFMVGVGVLYWQQALRLQEVSSNEALAIAEVRSLEDTVEKLQTATEQVLDQHDAALADHKSTADQILEDMSRKDFDLQRKFSATAKRMQQLEASENESVKDQQVRRSAADKVLARIARQQTDLLAKQKGIAAQQKGILQQHKDLVAKQTDALKDVLAKQEMDADAIAEDQKGVAALKQSMTERVGDLEAAMVYQDDRVNKLGRLEEQEWDSEKALDEEISSVEAEVARQNRTADANIRLQFKRQQNEARITRAAMASQLKDIMLQNKSVHKLEEQFAYSKEHERSRVSRLENRQKMLDADQVKQISVFEHLAKAEQEQGAKIDSLTSHLAAKEQNDVALTASRLADTNRLQAEVKKAQAQVKLLASQKAEQNREMDQLMKEDREKDERIEASYTRAKDMEQLMKDKEDADALRTKEMDDLLDESKQKDASIYAAALRAKDLEKQLNEKEHTEQRRKKDLEQLKEKERIEQRRKKDLEQQLQVKEDAEAEEKRKKDLEQKLKNEEDAEETHKKDMEQLLEARDDAEERRSKEIARAVKQRQEAELELDEATVSDDASSMDDGDGADDELSRLTEERNENRRKHDEARRKEKAISRHAKARIRTLDAELGRLTRRHRF